MKKSIKKAFTLAEIIFVMGIIGIVATLTVTNAKKDTDVTEKVAQLRKTEEVLSTAFAQAVTENGDISNWGANVHQQPSNEEVWNVISPYLKLKKSCETSTGCWTVGKATKLPSSTSTVNDNIDDDKTVYKGILANGASFAIDNYQAGRAMTAVKVDVNGPNKGTYRYGDDVFLFVIDDEGKVEPFGFEYQDGEGLLDGCITGKGVYCTAWVFQFGNQDYLKDCRNKLDWNGPQTCR